MHYAHTAARSHATLTRGGQSRSGDRRGARFLHRRQWRVEQDAIRFTLSKLKWRPVVSRAGHRLRMVPRPTPAEPGIGRTGLVDGN
jgi:hypothetical protein